MNIKNRIIEFSIDHYRIVTFLTILIAILGLTQFPKMKIDTDPENMLSETEFVRIFDRQIKKEFSMHDIIVLGIVNDHHSQGVFNKETLGKIFRITENIKSYASSETSIVSSEIMAPSTVDDIRQGSMEGEIKFEWLMSAPPADDNEAKNIGERAKSNPVLDGTIVSENGKALCIYVPITQKDKSYKISNKIKEIIEKEPAGYEKYYITGLPVAEDTFGFEMFKQMGFAAPLSGLIIFLLMFYFFRKVKLIIAPMIVAVVSIIVSMGLMIGLGYTVHIMSSMIAIFLMPIAVVDSVHIISDFFEKYQIYKDRKKTMMVVMNELFSAMLYTSLTSFAGFVSLATAPIPPVQVFGFFVGFGIMLAWILTITFVPASVMFISEKTLADFGTKKKESGIENENNSLMTRILEKLGMITFKHSKIVITFTFIVSVIAFIGITKIRINDNPVKWFDKKHDIRIADKVLNEHFGGTYMASLVLESDTTPDNFDKYIGSLNLRVGEFFKNYSSDTVSYTNVINEINKLTREGGKLQYSIPMFLDRLRDSIDAHLKNGTIKTEIQEEFIYFLEDEKIYAVQFKQPEMLEYIDKLQDFMNTTKVGKSNSVATIVKKIHQELRGGKPEFYKIPDNSKIVGECLIQFQNSHRPNDLWHFINTDYSKANIWVQLKSGDNTDMTYVIDKVNEFVSKNPSPYSVKMNWAGKTYINVVWQEKMVFGMLTNSLLSSYITVLIMMMILFRSIWFGILSMIPLTVTIGFIYGIIGFIGKDYDMPVAILSSLTLGMAVDFSIHFIERFKHLTEHEKDFETAFKKMFHEPASAITRNIIVIALGFLPLLLSPLVPYQTVGFFLTAIMIISGLGTLFILPAIMKDMIADFGNIYKK
ncbi:MMPL family transporter [Candidatus Dependentiae bacterium]|nr:MMPL family transporter [Candidatus Dependentiae bacterium]